jgi:copper(I)-binding protein
MRAAPTIFAALTAVLVGTWVVPAAAHRYDVGALSIVHPHARATVGGARTGAGYVRILNQGAAPDRLLSVTADVSERVELHQTVQQGGIMRMRSLPTGIALPAKGKVELKPGGMHIMFVGLKRPLKEGTRFDASLQFEKAGKVPVVFLVEAAGSKAGGKHDH